MIISKSNSSFLSNVDVGTFLSMFGGDCKLNSGTLRYTGTHFENLKRC